MDKNTKKDKPSSKASTRKTESNDLNIGYSVKLGDPSTEPQQSKGPSSPQDIRAALEEKLKHNPQALEALKEALMKGHKKEGKLQESVEKAKVFTAANLKKSFVASLKWIDSAVDYIIKKDGPNRNSLLQQARPPVIFGFWVAFFTFVVAGLWSGLAPLDSSSHATGFVVPSSHKQIIQHREGGVIDKIYVKEGEAVKAGQPLMKLSDTAVRTQLESFRTQSQLTQKQLAVAKEQLVDLEKLYKEGFLSKESLLQRQEREANLITRLSDYEARIVATKESFDRLLITSPVDGTVNQIQFHTIGSPIPSGATLMTVVPKDDNLIIEAYVRPDDIDSVHVGLKAKIRISAFKHRSVAPFEGTVTSISSDVVEPSQYHPSQASAVLQQGGLQYKVQISVDPEELKSISKYRNYELYPGMMADVMIVTGERTMLQYLLDPITATFWHAFIEK